MKYSRNRTIMGLKLFIFSPLILPSFCRNRTIMGLKRFYASRSSTKTDASQSNHYRIETDLAQVCVNDQLRRNLTIMGLKRRKIFKEFKDEVCSLCLS